MSPLQSPVNCS